MGYTFLLGIIIDVMRSIECFCRNISDRVRPFIPPCSLVSLYALTNMSYLTLIFHHLCWIYYLQPLRTHSLQSCYICFHFSLQLRIRFWNCFIFYVVMLKKAFKDFGCKLLTVISHQLLWFTISYYPLFFQYIQHIYSSLSFIPFARYFP